MQQTQIKKFLNVYRDIHDKGKLVESGGTITKELINYQFLVPKWPHVLTSFKARNLNLNYCKQEWMWYLRADRFDASIEDHASAWKKIKQEDGGYNSNYGQYIFGEGQFDWALKCLEDDIFSRQACIQLLNTSHMYSGNTDVVCTQGIQFLIRDGKLHMYVTMRSNDAIWGLTNDVFCFANLHMMMLTFLRTKKYPMLDIGSYYHRAGSLHVYERHFDMLTNLVQEGMDGYKPIDIPDPLGITDFLVLAEADEYLTYTSNYTEWMHNES